MARSRVRVEGEKRLSSSATQKPDGYEADQPVVALQQLRDAVAVEHPAHHPLDALLQTMGLMRIFSSLSPSYGSGILTMPA